MDTYDKRSEPIPLIPQNKEIIHDTKVGTVYGLEAQGVEEGHSLLPQPVSTPPSMVINGGHHSPSFVDDDKNHLHHHTTNNTSFALKDFERRYPSTNMERSPIATKQRLERFKQNFLNFHNASVGAASASTLGVLRTMVGARSCGNVNTLSSPTSSHPYSPDYVQQPGNPPDQNNGPGGAGAGVGGGGGHRYDTIVRLRDENELNPYTTTTTTTALTATGNTNPQPGPTNGAAPAKPVKPALDHHHDERADDDDEAGETMGDGRVRRGCCPPLPRLFERAASSWWDPRFDSDMLEHQLRRTSVPQMRRHLRFALAFVTISTLVWAVYLGAVAFPGLWRQVAASCALVIVLAIFCYVTTYTRFYDRYSSQVSLFWSITVCALSLVTFSRRSGTGGVGVLTTSQLLNLTATGLSPSGSAAASASDERITALLVGRMLAGGGPRDGGDASLSFFANFATSLQVLVLVYTFTNASMLVTSGLAILYSLLFVVISALRLSDNGAIPLWSMHGTYSVILQMIGFELLLHLCLHILGLHIFLMSQVRLHSTFWQIGQSLIAKKSLDIERKLKEKIIHSVMPPRVADELMQPTNEEEMSCRRRKSSNFPLWHHHLHQQQLQTCITTNGPRPRGSVPAGVATNVTTKNHHHHKGSTVPSARHYLSSPAPLANLGNLGMSGLSNNSASTGKAPIVVFRPFKMNKMDNVSILFADIVGFTQMSSNKTADVLVALLNDLFGRFDKLCEACGCEKIATLGDCYYCVSGCPMPRPDHAVCCVRMGLSMIRAIKEFDLAQHQNVNMRVGIHTGTVLCGVVGTRRFKFDVWSNDVTLANKLESTGKPGRVHVSATTLECLGDKYEVEPSDAREDIKSYFIVKPKSPKDGPIMASVNWSASSSHSLKRGLVPNYSDSDLLLLTNSATQQGKEDAKKEAELADIGMSNDNPQDVSTTKLSAQAALSKESGDSASAVVAASKDPSPEDLPPFCEEKMAPNDVTTLSEDRAVTQRLLMSDGEPYPSRRKPSKRNEDIKSMRKTLLNRQLSGGMYSSHSSITDLVAERYDINHTNYLFDDRLVPGHHLPPSLAKDVKFIQSQQRYDIQMVNCIKEDMANNKKNYFSNPPINQCCLTFKDPDLEYAYRQHLLTTSQPTNNVSSSSQNFRMGVRHSSDASRYSANSKESQRTSSNNTNSSPAIVSTFASPNFTLLTEVCVSTIVLFLIYLACFVLLNRPRDPATIVFWTVALTFDLAIIFYVGTEELPSPCCTSMYRCLLSLLRLPSGSEPRPSTKDAAPPAKKDGSDSSPIPTLIKLSKKGRRHGSFKRALARSRRIFKQFWVRQIFGFVVASLPAATLLVAYFRISPSLRTTEAQFYDFLLALALLHLINLVQMLSWLKALLSFIVAAIITTFIGLEFCMPPQGSGRSSSPHNSLNSSLSSAFHTSPQPDRRFNNIFQQHHSDSPLETNASAILLNAAANLSNRTEGAGSVSYVNQTHIYNPEIGLVPHFCVEMIISILLILFLVIFLNREFEINYRLNFKGRHRARGDKEIILLHKNQAEWLLHNIIPKHVVELLKETSKYSRNHKDVGIIFATIVNFNELYDESFEGGKECLRVLNEVIGDFDELLDKPQYRDIEKIKTIGSTFMAASGLNDSLEDIENDLADTDGAKRKSISHLVSLMDFAFDMLNVVENFNRDLLEFNFILRIGYNVGDVTAGVIGTTKLYYDIWGDAVNMASRMDSTGVPNRIQCPAYVVPMLCDYFEFEYRGEIYAKGKGQVATYLVKGRT